MTTIENINSLIVRAKQIINKSQEQENLLELQQFVSDMAELSPIQPGHDIQQIDNEAKKFLQKKSTTPKKSPPPLPTSHDMYYHILASISDAVFITDEDLNYTFVCPNAHVIFGYSSEEIETNIPLLELLGNNLKKGQIKKYVKNKKSNIEINVKDKPGNKHTLLLNIKEVAIDKGRYLFTCRDISERKTLYTQFNESEQRYATLFNDSYSVMLLSDLETKKIIDANKAACNYYGYSKKQILTKRIYDINISSRDELAREIQMAKKRKRNHFFFRHKLANNQIRHVEVYSGKIVLNQKELLFSTIHDIEKRVVSETLLKESEEKFRTFIAQSKDGFVIINNKGKVVVWNKAMVNITGVSKENAIGSYSWDVQANLSGDGSNHKQIAAHLKKQVLNVLQVDDHPWFHSITEYPIINTDGKKLFLQRTLFPIIINGKKHLGSINRDVSVQHEIQLSLKKKQEELIAYKEKLEELVSIRTKELQRSEERLRLAFAVTNEGLWEWYVETGKAHFSDKYYELLGYKPNEFPAGFEEWKKRLHPEDVLHATKFLENHLESKRDSYDIEFRMKKKNGEYAWILSKGKVVEWGKNKDPIRMVGTHNDITQRKEAEIELQKSEDKFRSLVEQTSDWIWELDKNLRYVYSSPGIFKILGYSAGEVIGKSPFDFMNEKEIVRVRKIFDNILEQKSAFSSLENWNIHKSGKRVLLDTSGVPIFNEKNEFAGYRGIDRDVTIKYELDKKILTTILQTEEKERNRMAKDLHDGLGALLSGVKMYINVLQRGSLEETKRKQFFEKIKELLSQAIENTREIANNLKPHDLDRFGLTASINALIERLNFADDIKIVFNHKNFTVRLKETHELVLYRLVFELINNTLKHAKAKNIYMVLYNSNNIVNLIYTDDGKGFSKAEHLQNDSSGNGLQNIISRIKSVGGTCEIFSSPGQGVDVFISIFS